MKKQYIISLLLLSAVDINGILVNVAPGKNTSQFTAPGDTIWSSSNANDGNKECQNIDSKHLSLSGNSHSPWWLLDLAEVFQIHQINVFGRNDIQLNQLQGFRLYLSLNRDFSENNIVYTNTAADYNKGHIIITHNLTGSFQFVKIDLPNTYRGNYPDGAELTGPIVLCEVEILVKMINIAVQKPVTMSSHYDVMTAGKSVDGNTRRDVNTCSCCSHSSNEINPWLTVDLLHAQEIFQIHVIGRSDDDRNNRRLTGLNIFANGTHNLVDGNYTSANASDVIVTLPQGLHSRYITLRRPKLEIETEWFLIVCELEVYVRFCKPGTYGNCQQKCGHCRDRVCNTDTGECPNGTCMAGWSGKKCVNACGHRKFGDNCSSSCNCLNNTTCHAQTGICDVGACDPGWQTSSCNKPCEHRKYGNRCSSVCHCLNNTTCNAQTGICNISKCEPGWRTQRCNESCSHRTFGKNCSSVCHCFNNTTCDAVTGICQVGSCDPGWKTQRCDKFCNDRTFGYNCSSTCNCLDNTHCNSTTGDCDIGLCDSGWQGPACDQECDKRTFGYNCSSTCNCLGNTYCTSTIGECVIGLCDPGWQGPACDHECDNRAFGYNCSSTCNCLDHTKYNSSTGECDIVLCDSGWQGPACDQVCINRTFGYNCSSKCNCLDHTNCKSSTGECNIGLCDPGWQGPACDQVCNDRTFGYNCSSKCYCLNKTRCNSTTGLCHMSLCDPGWQGPACDKECDNRTFGYNCSSTCYCLDHTNCNSSTGECNVGLCDPGWQGHACDQGRNLMEAIRNQVKTHMSSEAQNTSSYLAIDRLVGPDPAKCRCCSITSNSALSWWMLDLGKRYPLESVIIQGGNKGDWYQQLTGFSLLLLNNSNIGLPDIFLYNESKFTIYENRYEITLNNVLTRYIKIERPGVLTICEVVVVEGYCKYGTFGDECSQYCHCADNRPCDQLHGYCQSPICKLGWIGEACNESCPRNKFGEGCTQFCYCKEGTCSSDYGVCSGKCKNGYHGAHCNIVGSTEAEIEHTISAAVIGGSVAGSLILAVVLAFLLVLLWKHRLKQVKRDERENYYKSIHRNATQNDNDIYDTIGISQDSQVEIIGGEYENAEKVTGL